MNTGAKIILQIHFVYKINYNIYYLFPLKKFETVFLNSTPALKIIKEKINISYI